MTKIFKVFSKEPPGAVFCHSVSDTSVEGVLGCLIFLKYLIKIQDSSFKSVICDFILLSQPKKLDSSFRAEAPQKKEAGFLNGDKNTFTKLLCFKTREKIF